ncbi:MAG TPA: hypothetical protein VGR70_00725 [Stellaceae bacterium]|nr:hypothetical protein [Stellaceae bacterium]
MRVALAGLSLLLALSVQAVAQFDPDGLATRLKTGMTIGQALLALGNRPTSTLETTCRQVTGEPFTCRIWKYTTQFEELQIYFRYSEPQHEWLVYSWKL